MLSHRNFRSHYNEVEITFMEILVSIIIIAVMTSIGFLLSGKIDSSTREKNNIYNTALHIDNADLFKHALENSSGRAFVFGELKTVDPVSFKDFEGEYFYIERVKEEYRMHTRVVTETDSKGVTHTKTETYWQWDVVDRDIKNATKVTFHGIEFPASMFDLGGSTYKDTIKVKRDIRYIYRVIDRNHVGTIFANLKDNTIDLGNHSKIRFNHDLNTHDTMVQYVQDPTSAKIGFWVVWIMLTGGIVYGFYYLENNWLE